jgi:multidrug resistance efflux pump
MKKQLLERLDLQKGLENERYKLATNSYKRDSQLMSKSIISQEDYDNSQSVWLNASLAYEAVQKESMQTQSSIYELQQQKAGLQLAYDDELKAYRTNILRAYELVTMQVQSWYLNNVLLSPTKGKISFNRIWAVNQNVNQGETVLTVVPANPEGIIGKAYVSVRGAGKVKPGQRVNIKLSNYPYMEYGMLLGEVKRKAPVPVNNLYAIEIGLPNKLTTNY